MVLQDCCICDTRLENESELFTYGYDVRCDRCGRFKITDDAADDVEHKPLTPEQAANISGWLHENQGARIGITRDMLVRLRELRTPTPDQKALKLLSYLLRVCPKIGGRYDLDASKPLLASAAWAQDASEVSYLFTEVLAERMHLIQIAHLAAPSMLIGVVITAEAWAMKHAQATPRRPMGFVTPASGSAAGTAP